MIYLFKMSKSSFISKVFLWAKMPDKITTFVTAAHFIRMPIHRNPIRTPRSDPLGFRDLYQTLLNKLCSPRHRIGVDLYSGNDVCIPPAMDLCCSATEFDLHTSLHQVCNKLLYGLPVAILRSGLYAWSCNVTWPAFV